MRKLPSFTMCRVFFAKFSRSLVRSFRREFRHDRENTTYDDFLGERIIPPGTQSDAYCSFVASRQNPHGLQLDFHENDRGGVCCSWVPEARFQGYPETLHGGISFAILDELSAYAVFQEFRSYAVTIGTKTHWLRRVSIGRNIFSEAKVSRHFWRFVEVKAKILDHRGRECAMSTTTFYIPTKAEFRTLLDLNIMPEESVPYCGMD